MQFRTHTRNSTFSDVKRQPAYVLGLHVAACILGMAVVSIGSGSNSTFLGIGVLGLFAVAGGTLLLLDISFMALIRFAFVASFFFKADMMLFKVDEIEDPSGLNVSLLLATSLCLLVYDHFLDDDSERVLPLSATIFLIGLIVCIAASVIFTGLTPLKGFSFLSFLTSALVAYVTASHFSDLERIKELVIMIALGLVFTGVAALSQYAFEWPTNLSSLGTGTEEELLGTQSILLARVPAFLRTPNGMALVVSSLIPLILAPAVFRVRSFATSQRILLIGGTAVGIIAVILSLARGSWIALVVAIALLFLFGCYRLPSKERTSFIASTAAVVVLAGVMIIPFGDRIYDRIAEDDQGSAAIRVPMMETALRMIEENPILGVGPSGYRSNMTRYDETSIFVTQVFSAPVHNVFAHVTSEIGIPGGILFCLLILAALVECFRSTTLDDRLVSALAIGTAVGLVAFIISALKEPGSIGSVRPPMRTLFLLLGVAFAISRIRRRYCWNPNVGNETGHR